MGETTWRIVTTNTNLLEWEACMEGALAQSMWTLQYALMHINVLKLRVIQLALQFQGLDQRKPPSDPDR